MTCDCRDGLVITRRNGRTYVDECVCVAIARVKARHEKGHSGFPLYSSAPMVSDYEPGISAQHPAAARFARTWLASWTPGVGALLHGVTGSGKSRLACAMANELTLIRQRLVCQFVCCQTALPDGYKADDEWKDGPLQYALRADVVILDNVRDDFSRHRIDALADLCERLTRQRTSVIVTTTLQDGKLHGSGAWGDISSRLNGMAGAWKIPLGQTDTRRV